MSAPLFSAEELKVFEISLSDFDRQYREKAIDWSSCWKQQEATRQAHQVETAKRVRARADEFLNGLVVIVGERGSKYVDFNALFAESDYEPFKEFVVKHNTPEVRRTLHTILKALTEIPRSWAMSAFARFLRGTGKQAGAKYYGAGMLGVAYGWKEDEVLFFCRVLTDRHNPYANILVHYTDVVEEAGDDRYEIFDEKTQAAATNVVRDVEFLNQLCGLLEARGLAPVPTRAEAKPKKDHVPKVFKPGDVIRRKDLRDLPRPAHVRIPIERLDPDSKQWLKDTLERVVTHLTNDGRYDAYLVAPGQTAKAYIEEPYWFSRSKDELDGATFLGPWTGELVKGKKIDLKFRYRQPQTP